MSKRMLSDKQLRDMSSGKAVQVTPEQARALQDDRRSRANRSLGKVATARLYLTKWIINKSFGLALMVCPRTVRVEVCEGIILWIQRSIVRSQQC